MLKPETIKTARRKAATDLKIAGIESADLDARLLVQLATGVSRVEVITLSDRALTEKEKTHLNEVLTRRKTGEPIDHILGYREFYGYVFRVTSKVLSPRPETEGLVDFGKTVLSGLSQARILDIGTGSGAIIISLLKECPNTTGVATDISEEALKVARQNAETLFVQNRIEFRTGSWCEPLHSEMRFDLIVSNPPYITTQAMRALSKEVAKFDPELALWGGEDGLDPYRILAANVGNFLKPGGALAFEIGYDQGQAVWDLLGTSGYSDIEICKDGAGHDRYAYARKRNDSI